MEIIKIMKCIICKTPCYSFTGWLDTEHLTFDIIRPNYFCKTCSSNYEYYDDEIVKHHFKINKYVLLNNHKDKLSTLYESVCVPTNNDGPPNEQYPAFYMLNQIMITKLLPLDFILKDDFVTRIKTLITFI